ncbi:hypothetical protein K402DRAFT_92799 [Aulographum hederae CBS 113979]|uniref:Secreted protein n=1 Tax=Aulographum hederae CBS 113979 TaxID=1176131 RepID=A0A6G1GZ55_9PEZI|nr:hypothetical protein K402DRAFT_92799 [Aulographum hederae CBS 113979]
MRQLAACFALPLNLCIPATPATTDRKAISCASRVADGSNVKKHLNCKHAHLHHNGPQASRLVRSKKQAYDSATHSGNLSRAPLDGNIILRQRQRSPVRCE